MKPVDDGRVVRVSGNAQQPGFAAFVRAAWRRVADDPAAGSAEPRTVSFRAIAA
ncbi:hypothetical protein ACFW9L_32575 [Streptomyces sp. NPDC059517]|uniref:hypothetical protein n=1 Tax=Streptomyces sp. NPDC059517 TaxID=3346855 RepID=UPI00367F9148